MRIVAYILLGVAVIAILAQVGRVGEPACPAGTFPVREAIRLNTHCVAEVVP